MFLRLRKDTMIRIFRAMDGYVSKDLYADGYEVTESTKFNRTSIAQFIVELAAVIGEEKAINLLLEINKNLTRVSESILKGSHP